MGVFDLSVPELKQYQGINPKPADFEEYWERGLREIETIDPLVTLVPAAYQHPTMDCFELTFTGVHGARVFAKYVRPKHYAGRLPAIMRFHGYAGASHDWTAHFGYACAGFAVAALDVRGQGGRSEDVGGVRGNTLHGHIIRGLDDPDPDRLFFRDVFLDTALLTRIVASFPEIDEGRLAAQGGSQGGALTLACSALSNIQLAAPAFPFLSDYRRVWEMDLAKNAYAELTDYFRLFDPLHEHEEEVFTKLGYIDIQHLAHRIRSKVHMYTSLMDTVCPPSSQFATFNKITSPKKVILYPDYGHEDLPRADDMTLQWFIDELL